MGMYGGHGKDDVGRFTADDGLDRSVQGGDDMLDSKSFDKRVY